MKIEELSKKAYIYLLSSEASLRSDMAKRIMHSILPAVSDKTQTYMTGGAIDYKSLAAAIEGRKDIIKYGTIACARELSGYRPGRYTGSVSVDIPKGLSLALSGNYEESLNISIQCFEDYKNWRAGHGNKAWEQIAKTIKKLLELDKNLAEVRNKKHKNIEAELQIMQLIVVQLNVFDGLSHNNGSVMERLIEMEWRDKNPNEPNDPAKYKDSADAIARIMDAKELNNPGEVFAEIEEELLGSGDINRYKDWLRQIRSLPGYKGHNPKREVEMSKIRSRKLAIPSIIKLNNNIDILKSLMESLEPMISNVTRGEQMPSKFYSEYASRIASIRGNIAQAHLEMQNLAKKTDVASEMGSFIKLIVTGINTIKTNLAGDVSIFDRAWEAARDSSNVSDFKKIQLMSSSKKMQATINMAVHFLDSI
jgi:hypothetical protein